MLRLYLSISCDARRVMWSALMHGHTSQQSDITTVLLHACLPDPCRSPARAAPPLPFNNGRWGRGGVPADPTSLATIAMAANWPVPSTALAFGAGFGIGVTGLISLQRRGWFGPGSPSSPRRPQPSAASHRARCEDILQSMLQSPFYSPSRLWPRRAP